MEQFYIGVITVLSQTPCIKKHTAGEKSVSLSRQYVFRKEATWLNRIKSPVNLHLEPFGISEI